MNSFLARRSFFRDSALVAGVRNRPSGVAPFLQVIPPGTRFELSETGQTSWEELELAWPAAPSELLRFLDELQPCAREIDQSLDSLPVLARVLRPLRPRP